MESEVKKSLDLCFQKSNLKWLEKETIYLTKFGSHAYGTSTPSSDLDVRGVCIPPVKQYSLGVLDRFEQAIFPEPIDLTIFGIQKFVHLTMEANPNCLEILFTDPSDHLFVSPEGESLLSIRDLFLSKKCRYTNGGYAHQQLKRLIGHRKWLLSPPKKKPERSDFGLSDTQSLIPSHQLLEIEAAIRKVLEEWTIDTTGMDKDAAIKFKNELHQVFLDLKINSEELDLYAARYLGLNDNLVEEFKKERAYKSAKRDWKNYQDWKEKRNPDRAALEEKFGFDCYSDDTEFLTRVGWKKFDDVLPDDELATIFVNRKDHPGKMEHRPLHGVEYERYTDRFDALYNGPMYHLTGQHTDTLVSANHRMLFRRVERASEKEFDWQLEEANFLPDTFDVLIAPNPKKTTYSNKEIFSGLPIPQRAYMTLMGWYLSDGCATFDTDGDGRPKSVRISQDVKGKLASLMKKWNTHHGSVANSSIYEYERQPNEYNPYVHVERILDVRNPEIVSRMIKECGFTKGKRIPRYVFELSRPLMEHLLMGLIKGDGTVREHKTKDQSWVYYSSLKPLADDVQELGLMCGWETALWGPFECDDGYGRRTMMYQVHLRKIAARTRRFVRGAAIEKVEAQNQRIVCFTVPNGTLITRRNGKIGIHGNCKHGMHLCRLFRMCDDLLRRGVYKVKRDDAEELLAIRNGAWTYDQLIEYAEKMEKELDDLYVSSSLRKEPERGKINQWLIGLLEGKL